MESEQQEYSDEELEQIVRAAARYEEMADSFMGGSILQTAIAVYAAAVDDVRYASIELMLEGDPGETYEITSNKHVIRDARVIAGGMKTTPALATNQIRRLSRGSAESLAWYLDWVGVFLQASARSLIFPAETLQPGQWERLAICMQIRTSNGQRTTIRSNLNGTTVV